MDFNGRKKRENKESNIIVSLWKIREIQTLSYGHRGCEIGSKNFYAVCLKRADSAQRSTLPVCTNTQIVAANRAESWKISNKVQQHNPLGMQNSKTATPEAEKAKKQCGSLIKALSETEWFCWCFQVTKYHSAYVAIRTVALQHFGGLQIHRQDNANVNHEYAAFCGTSLLVIIIIFFSFIIIIWIRTVCSKETHNEHVKQ